MLQAQSALHSGSSARKEIFWSAVASLLALLTVSCGSSNHTNQNLSPAQAQAISHEFVIALESALASVSSGLPAAQVQHTSLPAVLQEVRPQASSDCTTNSNGETCNIPVSFTGPCLNGGRVSVAGDFDFTLNNSGDGTDSTTLTVTPTNCTVSNLTLNGDPNVMVGTRFSIASDQLQFPVTGTEIGGISYGPNPSGSCSMNVTLTVNSATRCTVSGSVCGQSVSGSC
jgi:hypothetical protein